MKRAMVAGTSDPFRDIKTFKWSELHGKSLEIHVSESKDGVTVMGKGIDGKYYVLLQEFLR